MKSYLNIGTVDVDYPIERVVGGKRVKCPYYVRWSRMLDRAYSEALHRSKPYYVGTEVDPEWHSFSAFRSWMRRQHWKGMALDKDALVPGNRAYGPRTAAFITPELNSALQRVPGEYPGVHVVGGRIYGRYEAGGKGNRVRRYLGRFDSKQEASRAWRKARRARILELARQERDPRVLRSIEKNIDYWC